MGTLNPTELSYLRAVDHCTDEAGLPIMSHEAATVMSLERLGLIRIVGENQNRTKLLSAGREALRNPMRDLPA